MSFCGYYSKGPRSCIVYTEDPKRFPYDYFRAQGHTILLPGPFGHSSGQLVFLS